MKLLNNKGFSLLHVLPMVAIVAVVAVIGVKVMQDSKAAGGFSCSVSLPNSVARGAYYTAYVTINNTLYSTESFEAKLQVRTFNTAGYYYPVTKRVYSVRSGAKGYLNLSMYNNIGGRYRYTTVYVKSLGLGRATYCTGAKNILYY